MPPGVGEPVGVAEPEGSLLGEEQAARNDDAKAADTPSAAAPRGLLCARLGAALFQPSPTRDLVGHQPLVDLDGRTVAINIARAGRVASFAVPASVVLPLLEELKSGKLNPQQVVSGVAGPADGTMPTSVTKP